MNDKEKQSNERIQHIIDKSIPVPLYYQLIHVILDQIKSGELKPGDMLPTENELKNTYGLSQITVRRAISELVHDNVVEVKRPKGAFVCFPKVEEYSNGLLTSFTEEFDRGGFTTSSKILQLKTIPIYGNIAEELKVAVGSETHYLYRIRYINGQPVSLNLDYIPKTVVLDLSSDDFTNTGKTQSLYYILREKYGLKLTKAIETISAVSLDNKESSLLEVAPKTPAINRKRLVFDAENHPIILEQTIILYTYKTTLSAK